MMIGTEIKGVDQDGKPCQGIILDKVRTLATITIKNPATIGPGQSVPFALDAYLVLSDDGIHLVQPQFISGIHMPADTEAEATGNNFDL